MKVVVLAFVALLGTARAFVEVDSGNYERYLEYRKSEASITVYHLKGHKMSQGLVRRIDRLERRFAGVTVFALACSKKFDELCRGGKPKSMPHVEVTRFGVSKGVSGHLPTDQLRAFISSQLRSDVSVVKSRRQISKATKSMFLDNAIVAVKGEVDAEFANEISRLAFKYQESLKMFKLGSGIAIKAFRLQDRDNGVYLLRHDNPEAIAYSKASSGKLEDFVLAHQFNGVTELDRGVWNTFNSKDGVTPVILFAEHCSKVQLYKFNEAGTFINNLKTELFVLRKSTDAAFFNELKLNYGVPDKCTLMAVKQRDSAHPLLHVFHDSFDSHNISFFINGCTGDRLSKYTRSKPRSLLDEGEVNRAQLADMLRHHTKGAFVLYLRQADLHSERHSQFADLERSAETYETRFINADHNDLDNMEGYSLPVVLFHSKDGATGRVEYKGPLNGYAMERFAKSSAVELKQADVA